MEFYSTRVRCTNCGAVFIREFQKGSTITESSVPCSSCGTTGKLEAVSDDMMIAPDGRQILHEHFENERRQ